MLRARLGAVLLAALLSGCASAGVRFPNVTPGAPLQVSGTLYRPAGRGPFPAIVLLHGCHGVLPATRAWARWFRARGYVALVVDSWSPRGISDGCLASAPDIPPAERFDDAIGALRFLQARPDVDGARVGVVGWSNGGVFAIAVVNGPSLERARARGVALPSPGYRAAVAFYPGGCYSLVQERVVRPLLVLLGAADDWTVPAPCVEMIESMRARGADASVVLYPGAYHYFDVEGQPRAFLTDVGNRNRPEGGATVAYDPAAAADAHRRVAEFFGYHLGGRETIDR